MTPNSTQAFQDLLNVYRMINILNTVYLIRILDSSKMCFFLKKYNVCNGFIVWYVQQLRRLIFTSHNFFSLCNYLIYQNANLYLVLLPNMLTILKKQHSFNLCVTLNLLFVSQHPYSVLSPSPPKTTKKIAAFIATRFSTQNQLKVARLI